VVEAKIPLCCLPLSWKHPQLLTSHKHCIMSPRYIYDGPSTAPPLTSNFRLASRKSFTLSPSTSPDSSPRKRVRPKRDISPTFGVYRLLWTALCIGLLLFSALQWTTQPPPPPLQSEAIIASPLQEKDRWKDVSVVQVLQTRFMQEQPHLVELGMARLEIFKTLSLPTVIQQTSQDFLWIIRTDPNLNATIQQPLINLIKDYPHIVLVASNGNPEGFRGHEAIADISIDNIWSGSYDLVQDYHAAAQSRIVLESRLDADDGIHLRFVEYMQAMSPKYLSEPNSWMVWCASSHLEWHYNSPFSNIKENVEYGFLLGIKNKECVTPGLSMGYGIGATRGDLPRGTHQYLHKVLPECSSTQMHSCLHRFWELKPGALRARTPTSAGMSHLVEAGNSQKITFKRGNTQAQLQSKMWDGAETIFGIQREDIVGTKEYVVTHLAGIASDNLKGQCTKGHSCKQEAKDLLKLILQNHGNAVA